MSLNGLVHPEREKCESANWRWVRAHQLAPQGLGPYMDLERKCDYGSNAPYTSPKVQAELQLAMPFRVAGYPFVTECSRLGPLLYYLRVDPSGVNRPQQWPYGYYCGKH